MPILRTTNAARPSCLPEVRRHQYRWPRLFRSAATLAAPDARAAAQPVATLRFNANGVQTAFQPPKPPFQAREQPLEEVPMPLRNRRESVINRFRNRHEKPADEPGK